MKNEIYIREEVDKTLNSLEGMQRAEASPFMLTRVQQAIRSRAAQNSAYHKVWRLAIAMMVLAVLNGAYFLQSRNTGNGKVPAATAATVAADYSLQVNVTDF